VSTGLERVPLPGSIASALPTTYFELLDLLGPGAGFVGNEYIRLFAVDELESVNREYETERYLPGFYIIGSTGCGEAYAFDLAKPASPVFKVAFVPLDPEYLDTVAVDILSMATDFAGAKPASEGPFPPLVNTETLGHEVHEKQPLALGGPPTAENQVLVPTVKHAELCRFWNKAFQRIRDESRKGASGR
jgi:hypothetical protein